MLTAVTDLVMGAIVYRHNQPVNVLAYADDVVVIVPLWAAVKLLLNILYGEAAMLDMKCNVNENVCIHDVSSYESSLVVCLVLIQETSFLCSQSVSLCQIRLKV